jgi:hypothetical protein
MPHTKRPTLWLSLVLIFVLVACGTGTENAGTNNTPTSNQVSSEDPVSTTAPVPLPTEPIAEPTPEVAPSDNSETQTQTTEILTTDDRSDRLRSLTAAWNTNWALHTIDYSTILSGGPPRDGIPSLDNPVFVTADEASEWLADVEPVIALEVNGDARAYPLQVVTWHEIVNDTIGGIPAIITFCPLCNSALAFERTVMGEVFEFGVSGLLANSDLIMYDRTNESLWQQFTGQAIVGDLTGHQLTFLPSQIVSFADFRSAFPDGQILSRDTGFNRRYGENPYSGYDTIGSNPFLFNGELDDTLPAVERVVSVSLVDEGLDIAYPLSVLSAQGVINDKQGNTDLVVFHTAGTTSALGASSIADAEDVGATGVFDPNLNGQTLTFSKSGDDILDDQTGSTWNILGQAVAGELAGQRLTPIVHGDHFWFSWAAFKPNTVVYGIN